MNEKIGWMMVSDNNVRLYVALHILFLVVFVLAAIPRVMGVLAFLLIAYMVFLLQNALSGFGAILDASIYLRAKDFSRARRELERAIRWGADYYVIYNDLAYVIARQGRDLDYALTLSQEAISRRPSSPYCMGTYGWILTLQGRFREGQQYLIQAIKEKPNNMEILFHLGHSYMMTGDDDKGKRLLTKCYKNTNRKLYTEFEWNLICSYFDTKVDTPITFRRRIKQVDEIKQVEETVHRRLSYTFHLLLLTIIAIAIIGRTPELQLAFTSIIDSLPEEEMAGYLTHPSAYTLFIQIYVIAYACLSFITIRIGIEIISHVDPSKYVAALIITKPLTWKHYIDGRRKGQSSFIAICSVLFLIACIVVPIAAASGMPSYMGVYIRRLFLLVAIITSLTSIINNYRQKYHAYNPIYTDDYIAKNSIVRTLSLSYVVLCIFIMFKYGEVAYQYFSLSVYVIGLHVSELINLNMKAIEIAGQDYISGLPQLWSAFDKVRQDSGKLVFELPIVFSSLLILGNGFIYWGLKRALQQIIICGLSFIIFILFEYILMKEVYGEVREINFNIAQLAAFTLTIVISFFASPARETERVHGLKDIKGIGPKREKLLNDLGIYNCEELIEFDVENYEFESQKRINCENKHIVNIKPSVIRKWQKKAMKLKDCMQYWNR